MKNKINIPKNILILINSSWGEIDWILPVCQYIKNNYPEVKITALFNHMNSGKIMKGNVFLQNLFFQNVHNCYETKDFLPPLQKKFVGFVFKIYDKVFQSYLGPYIDRRIYNFFFKLFPPSQEIMDKINPEVLLKDTSGDSKVRKKIILLARKNGCREIMFPHATDIYYEVYNIFQKLKNKKSKSRFFADQILCNTKWMTFMIPEGNKTYQNKQYVVGIPRYDEWWVQYLQKYWEENNLKKQIGHNRYPIFLFYTTEGGMPITGLSEDIISELFHQIMKTLISFQNSFVIIKPHPRQNLNRLKNNLKKYDRERWTIDQSQAMMLSSMADVVISIAAHSVFLDSLAVKKPIIEYIREVDITKYIELRDSKCKRDERPPISNVSQYIELHLAAPAYDVKQLKYWIEKFKTDTKEKKSYITNFDKVLSKSKDPATKKAADVILGFSK